MRRFAPVFVLLLLAPVVAEVLFGATPVSNLGGLLSAIAVYGCGALLIRELVRRRGLGWSWIAALGVAYGLVEEGLALGSLFNPELFDAGQLGGRALGINWVWTEWTLGYHAVWSISIPILLAELLFPARRSEPWLGRMGLAIAGVVYALGVVFFAAIFRFVVAPGFVVPALPFAGAALVVASLVVLALRKPVGFVATAASAQHFEPVSSVPSPWLVGLLAFLVADAWFVLLHLPDALRIGAWVLIPMLVGVALVALVVVLVGRWSAPGAGGPISTAWPWPRGRC